MPSDIGVYVTEHPFSPVITDRNINWLRRRFKNFIYNPEHKDIRWASQFIVPHVDGVITVSSSLGYQAVFHGKYLCVIGESHLSVLADTNQIDKITPSSLDHPRCKDEYLYFILTRYHPLFSRYVLKSDWLPNLIRKTVQNKKNNLINESFFEPFDSSENIRNHYLNDLRRYKYASFPKNTSSKKVKELKQELILKKYNLDEMKLTSGIKEAKIISFDIFDTLLVRVFDSPQYLNDRSSSHE